jgi:hypothetical protein
MTGQKKNPHAVALGKRGGQKKVPKGAATLTPEERQKFAKSGAEARWGKKKETSKRKRTNSLAK